MFVPIENHESQLSRWFQFKHLLKESLDIFFIVEYFPQLSSFYKHKKIPRFILNLLIFLTQLD